MIEHLTEATFREKIFDFTQSNEFKYTGELPVLVDFYASWCGPCKMIAPILEELAEAYAGKMHIYKVDTEKEEKLAAIFGIRSIPSLLFIPTDGGPMMDQGAKTKQQFEELFLEILNVKKPEEPKKLEE